MYIENTEPETHATRSLCTEEGYAVEFGEESNKAQVKAEVGEALSDRYSHIEIVSDSRTSRRGDSDADEDENGESENEEEN